MNNNYSITKFDSENTQMLAIVFKDKQNNFANAVFTGGYYNFLNTIALIGFLIKGAKLSSIGTEKFYQTLVKNVKRYTNDYTKISSQNGKEPVFAIINDPDKTFEIAQKATYIVTISAKDNKIDMNDFVFKMSPADFNDTIGADWYNDHHRALSVQPVQMGFDMCNISFDNIDYILALIDNAYNELRKSDFLEFVPNKKQKSDLFVQM